RAFGGGLSRLAPCAPAVPYNSWHDSSLDLFHNAYNISRQPTGTPEGRARRAKSAAPGRCQPLTLKVCAPLPDGPSPPCRIAANNLLIHLGQKACLSSKLSSCTRTGVQVIRSRHGPLSSNQTGCLSS